MTIKNEPDKLAQDAAAALAAGMTYGKWKALQPIIPIEPKTPKESFIEHVCEHCGCKFIRHDCKRVKYCGEKCRDAAARKREKERSCSNGGKE